MTTKNGTTHADSNKISSDTAIGVFDSGLGGLTVLGALQAAMPCESYIYLGDTARLPYGIKSEETVIRYALACARYLVERSVKAIVVACNTVSAVALPALRAAVSVPVFGVIEPSANLGQQVTTTGVVGVLATETTVSSGAYPRAFSALNMKTKVIAQPAPLLVPLIEEGWVEGSVPEQAVDRYLAALFSQDARIDTVLLGCTHYPLIKTLVMGRMGRHTKHAVQVIDSASAIAHHVVQADSFEKISMRRRTKTPQWHIAVTDRPKHFEEVASRFLGRPAGRCEWVSLSPC